MVIYDYSDGGKDSFAGVRICSVFGSVLESSIYNSDRGAIGPFYQGKMRLNIWHKIVSLTLAKRAAGRVRGALKLKFKEIGI